MLLPCWFVRVLALLATLLFAPGSALAAPRAMTVADMFAFHRVSDPQINPAGTHLVYTVGTPDLEANRVVANLWLASADGKTPARQLTTANKGDRHARWSPDGKFLLFESRRSGTTQLWVLPIAGGEARQLTTLASEAGSALWSPDGKAIAFVSAVYPEFSDKPFAESDAANRKKQEATEKSPVKAKVFKQLFYRHWDEYVEDKRLHLLTMSFDPATLTAGTPKDVTPGDRDAVPTSSTFSQGDDYAFSPDGTHLVFTAVPERDEAWSTNHDLCRVPVGGGKVENLTSKNDAADVSPRFSPDGKHLAWRAQAKAGYEADEWEILVAPCEPSGKLTGKPVNVTKAAPQSPGEYIWMDERTLMFTADDNGSTPRFTATLAGKCTKIADPSGMYGSLSASRGEKPLVASTQARMEQPPEVVVGLADALVNVSQANTKLLGALERPRPESVEVTIAGGKMQMWLLKPPGFDATKKWPVVYLVHGGPQGAWEDGWSYRWNPALWAAQGYVVALPNPRGSTGFGQKFVDEISGDWGGKCYDDLVKGLDHVEALPYVDKSRIGAAGASFGGYMMNWFAVSTNRFKCLITHCSVWNFESMWGTTDELWFDEWEHGGLPWDKPQSYAKFSPHKKAANLAKFKTPMLVIHNDLDFRCPIGQGHELFTALQRQKVPSKMINFPDEGHWVLKPRNSEFWHNEAFAWLKKYCPPGGK